MSQPVVLNLDKICRACLKEKEDMAELFQNKTNKMYTSCTTIKLQLNDELPQKICVQCLEQVKQFYAFKKSCLDSDCYLRQYLKEVETQRLKQEIKENLELSQELGIIGSSMETIDNEQIVDLTHGPEVIEMLKPKEEVVDEFKIIDLDSVLKQDPLENQIEQINFPEIDVPSTVKVEKIETPEEVSQLQAALNEFNTKMFVKSPVKPKIKEKKRFHCNRCNKTFDRRGHLLRHMPQHEEFAKEPYKCIKCSKEYRSLMDLSKHFETHATGKKTVECPKCNQIFPTFNRLLVHISLHVGEDGAMCSICHKHTFKMKQHFLSHLEHKPFTCCVCGQSFISNYCFKMHMKRHNGTIRAE